MLNNLNWLMPAWLKNKKPPTLGRGRVGKRGAPAVPAWQSNVPKPPTGAVLGGRGTIVNQGTAGATAGEMEAQRQSPPFPHGKVAYKGGIEPGIPTGSFLAGGGTIVNQGTAGATAGEMEAQRQSPPFPHGRVAHKGGTWGNWATAGEIEAQRQSPPFPHGRVAYKGGIEPGIPTGSFLAGGGTIVNQGTAEPKPGTNEASPAGGTRWVRTDTGWQEVPLQPGMLTGTFFSGGGPKLILNPPSGEDYNWQGNTRNENENVILGGGSGWDWGGGGSGGGWGGGGSGGGWGGGWGGGGSGGGWGDGGGYPQRIPSWLMNLYNWNFKG